MKKFLLIVLGGMLTLSAFADEADKNGLISGWKFVPVQVGVGDFNSNNLFNQNSVAMFSLGLIGVKQYSSIISLGTISHLENNYGLQLSLLSLTNTNYGVMIGFENAAGQDENYGIKIGIFNVSGKFAKGQFIGVDFFDLLQGKPELAEEQNAVQPLQSGIVIEPVSRLGDFGGSEQTDGVVMVKRAHADTSNFCNLSHSFHSDPSLCVYYKL